MRSDWHLLDSAELASPFRGDRRSAAVIDLDTAPEDAAAAFLPPMPVIGVGNRTHPLAAALDLVIEPPANLDTILAQIGACPNAAEVTVQLLRLIGGLPAEAALTLESLAYGVLQGGKEHARWMAQRPDEAASLPPGRVATDLRGETLTITMMRQEAGNAIDRPMRDGLREAFELAALDPQIARVRLVGEGRTFSLGAELGEFGTTRDPAEAHAIRTRTLPAHAIALCAEKLEVHVQGACVGAGLEMAAFARRLTASPRAWFHLPELAMGLLPGAGGCVSLSRRIGRQRTALLVLSGRRIGARTALGWGLIDGIVDDGAANHGQAHVFGEKP